MQVVQYILQQGADINTATNEGATPLLIATHQGHVDIVNYLRSQGAV